MSGHRLDSVLLRPEPRGQRLGIPLLGLAGIAAATAVIAAGHLDWLALFIVGALAVAAAYRCPVLSIAAVVLLSALSFVFLMTPWLGVSTASVFNVPIQALPLLPLACAVLLRAAVLAVGSERAPLPRFLPLAITFAGVLAALMLVAVVRGYVTYSLSALREFTVGYLGLIIVPYVALFLRSSRDIMRVFKAVALVGVVVPFALLPIVGQLKGWDIGPQSRYYPSVTHMGIMYSLVAAYLLQARHRSWRHLLAVVTVPAAVLIVVDSHRSAWLGVAVSLIVLIAARRIRLERVWKWGAIAILVVVFCGVALAMSGKDPVGFVASRAAAFIDPAADVTASWRLSIWRSAVEQSRQHLVLGQGFGSYFDFQLTGGRVVTVEPHNFYVQVFLKLGIAGLLAYLGAAAALLATLTSAWRRMRAANDLTLEPVVLMGVVAACASLAYGLVYAFDAYSLLFVGLALAAVLSNFRSVHQEGLASPLTDAR
jgi:hypothetical protein